MIEEFAPLGFDGRADEFGEVAAALGLAEIGAFDVGAEGTGSGVGAGAIGVDGFEAGDDFGVGGGGGGGAEGGDAVAGVVSKDLVKVFGGRVHEVGTGRAVDVDIDEAGGDMEAGRVDYGAIGGDFGPGAGVGDAAGFREDERIGDGAGVGDQGAVDEG